MGSSFAATIVIPVLDQDDAWLDQCVQSALRQTIGCEVIVVSSPKTRPSNLALLQALKSQYGNLHLIAKSSLGFPSAINSGFKAASAERVGLLLSDDWLEPQAVELCLQHDVDIVSSGNRVFAADGISSFEEMQRTPDMRSFLELKTVERKARYLQHFFLFRTSKLLEIGGADETLGDFPGIDDFDMVWVLLEHGASVAIVERQLYNYRDHDGERLTLRSAEQATKVLGRILDKHRVVGPERAQILYQHSRWYGRPIHIVFEEIRQKQSPS